MRVIDISRYKSLPTQDWISPSQIGRKEWPNLTLHEYLDVESRYLRALHRFIEAARVPTLLAHALESWEMESEALDRIGLADVFDGRLAPKEGEELTPDRLDNCFKRCLRDVAWLEFVSAPDFLIRFEWDLHVVVAFEESEATNAAISATRSDGLYVRNENQIPATLRAMRESGNGDDSSP